MGSYKDALTELMSSLEGLNFADQGSPISAGKAHNLPWLDVSALNCEEQQQFIGSSFGCEDQQQFILSPSASSNFGKFSSNKMLSNDNNKVVGAEINGPDLGWVNELLM